MDEGGGHGAKQPGEEGPKQRIQAFHHKNFECREVVVRVDHEVKR